MENASHDGFGKNVEQVGSHCQNTFNPDAHQGRGNDEPTSCSDTTRYQTGTEPDTNGGQKNFHGEERRTVGVFSTKILGKPSHKLIRKHSAADKYRD